MDNRQQLEQAITHLETQRATLGDAAIEAALTGLHQKLAELEPATSPSPPPLTDLPTTEERKLVTVVFADLSGFTAMSEKMDPEAVRNMMNACFERLVPVIKKYDGTVDKFIGDEIMALFGAPVAHENDPERAVRAALDMQTALTAFNAEYGTDLGIHFGINTGLVLAGSVGAEGRKDYTVIGDAVNLAARLEDASECGQIFVGPDTNRATATLFDYETLPPLKLKGKAELVPVYCVRGAKAAVSCQRRGLTAHGLQSPLVARAQEVAALHVCLDRLLKGQGGIIGITGEAGLGKSRLLAEVRGTVGATGRSPLWLEGHALSFGQSISYWPFQEILRSYAGITEDDSEAEIWCKLERKVAALFPETTAEILPYLGSLLTLIVPEKYQSRVKYLDGEGLGKQIFLTSWRFWERLALRQPVVLVFEDLHWMDESSFRLVEHLLPLVTRVPLLLIGLSRPGPETAGARLREKLRAEYADHHTDLRLMPLSPLDSVQLMRNLLAIENLPPRMRDLMVHKAEGNPFFLEEIIRMLIETGAVERDARTGQWRATAQTESLAIPDTVQGVIMARVDRLDEGVKQVLRLASVIGRNFLYRVLRALDEADREIDQHLAELQAVELIQEKQVTPELAYVFKHALVQEATYESILLQKRRELHAQVGQAIEALFADRLDEFYGLLAYHYAKAEAWEKTHQFLMKAADQAGRMAADAEVLNHYRQAIIAYGRAFGDKWEPLQRARLERKMGEALFRRGEHAQALEYLERGMTLLGYPLPASRREVYLAIAREVFRQAGHRLLPSLFLRKIGQPTPVMEEIVNMGLALIWIFVMSDQKRLLWLTLRGVNMAEQNGLDDHAAMMFSGMGYHCDLMGLFWLSKRYHRLGVALLEKTQLLGVLGLTYQCLMNHQLYLGDIDIALENGRRSAQSCREIGDLRTWGAVTDFMVRALIYRGDFLRAIQYFQECIRLGQEGGDKQIGGWGLTAQGFTERRRGHLDEAQVYLQQAIEILDTVPDYLGGVDARGELGRCYLQQGQLSQALAILEECPATIKEKNLMGLHVTPARNGLAEAYLVAAEQASQKEKSEWLQKAGRACGAALKQGKIFRPGLPEALRLQGRYQWLRGRMAQAKQWWQRSLCEAEAMGLRYDEGMVYLEMGKRLGGAPILEKAAGIFAAIGAEYDLAKACAALEPTKR